VQLDLTGVSAAEIMDAQARDRDARCRTSSENATAEDIAVLRQLLAKRKRRSMISTASRGCRATSISGRRSFA